MDGSPGPLPQSRISSANQDINLKYSIWKFLKENNNDGMSLEAIISHFNPDKSSEFLSWNIRWILLALLRNNFIAVSSCLKMKPKTFESNSNKKDEETLIRKIESFLGEDINEGTKNPKKSPLAY